MSEKGEQIVRDKLNFHPDIPLTRKYQELADAINTALARIGCPHCTCTCDCCAPCGEADDAH